MTFGEIYNRVSFYIWGNSAVPQGASAVLQGNEGLIANAHRKIMMDDNYWFMHTWVELPIVSGTQSYALPSGFKEVITILFKVDGEDFFGLPLSPLGGSEAHESKWQSDGTGEYAEWYEIVDEIITLYPEPSAARTLHLIYWKMFARPATATFTASTDDLTSYGADLITYMTVAEMFEIQREYDASQVYRMKADEERMRLINESKRRMQSHLYEIKYRGV